MNDELWLSIGRKASAYGKKLLAEEKAEQHPLETMTRQQRMQWLWDKAVEYYDKHHPKKTEKPTKD